MKAETAVITINGKSTLKVRLVPETEGEHEFLEYALRECEDYEVSAAVTPPGAAN
jgi:hypothetical protein